MFKKLNKKGFTLAELLIVVAIIAVLVAISIPIFTSQLEKSRDAVTVSNMRAAYAEATAAYLTANGNAVTDGDVVVAAPTGTSGSRKTAVTVKNVVAKGTSAGFNGVDTELPFYASATSYADMGEGGAKNSANGGKYDMVFTFTENSSAAPTVTVSAVSSGS